MVSLYSMPPSGISGAGVPARHEYRGPHLYTSIAARKRSAPRCRGSTRAPGGGLRVLFGVRGFPINLFADDLVGDGAEILDQRRVDFLKLRPQYSLDKRSWRFHDDVLAMHAPQPVDAHAVAFG